MKLRKGDIVKLKSYASVIPGCSCRAKTTKGIDLCMCNKTVAYVEDEQVGIFMRRRYDRYYVITPKFGEVWVWKYELKKVEDVD